MPNDSLTPGRVYMARLRAENIDGEIIEISVCETDSKARVRHNVGLIMPTEKSHADAVLGVLERSESGRVPFHVEFTDDKDPECEFNGLARFVLSGLTETLPIPKFVHPEIGIATLYRSDRVSTNLSAHANFLNEGKIASGVFLGSATIESRDMDLRLPSIPTDMPIEPYGGDRRIEYSEGFTESNMLKELYPEKRRFRDICKSAIGELRSGDRIMIRANGGECEPVYELGWQEELRAMDGRIIKSQKITSDGETILYDIPVMGYELYHRAPSSVGYIFRGREEESGFDSGTAFQKVLFPGIVNCGYVEKARVVEKTRDGKTLVAKVI